MNLFLNSDLRLSSLTHSMREMVENPLVRILLLGLVYGLAAKAGLN